jgi:hypothetical protein
MGNFLLLKNRNECPKCRAERLCHYDGRCINCGVLLFSHPIDFHKWESDGNPTEWWLFNSQKGWMHRSHVMIVEQPLERWTTEIIPDLNTKTAEQRVDEIKTETRKNKKHYEKM